MDQSQARRQLLIETLRQRGALHDEAVASAFRSVPREPFLPGVPLERVYSDEAIVTKTEGGVPISSSSQPAIMAIMLEQLDVRPGMQVLEIGAGTGYNAALLQRLAGETGRVVTVEIDPEVTEWARARLAAAGYPEVVVVWGDGADGYDAAAPYDRIELTVGTAEIAPAWVDQLREGGVLVLPLWINAAQVSIALEKRDGWLRSRSIQPCGFMRIRGKLAGPDQFVPLMPGVTAAVPRSDLPLPLVRDLLRQAPRRERWPGGNPTGFFFCAMVWGGPAVALWSEDAAEVGFSGGRFGYLDADEPGLCLLPAWAEQEAEPEVLVYGAPAARDRLYAAYDRWREIGSPLAGDLILSVYPAGSAPDVAPHEVAVDTRWWRLVFSRPDGQPLR